MKTNPKSEYLNPKQILNSKYQNYLNFGYLILFRISNLGFRILFFLILLTFITAVTFADDSFNISGRLNLHGVEALDERSAEEDPSVTGRLKFNVSATSWSFHSWLEGGWDGAAKRPYKDNSLFKSYDEVYQDNNPYLEFKEFYGEHSSNSLDLKAGIQRFAWGRLDEYPPNDLLNPWDYTQFLRKPLEDRKIGVPSLSANINSGDWIYETVWVPYFVPYRLALPDERWSLSSGSYQLAQIPNVEIIPSEPDLPARTMGNSNIGLRVKRTGEIEWTMNLFHGYDPRPVFASQAFIITPTPDKILIDPGYAPDFHRITVIGMDAAAVQGDLSLRAEAAYAFNRYFNVRPELWGYPNAPAPGAYPLNPIEIRSDALDYGIGADYRMFEDGFLIVQAQQKLIFDRTDALYDRKIETILWANIKVGWMNQKLETNVGIAYNPEHGSNMTKANVSYTFTDFWKAGVSFVAFTGPAQSIFGRFAMNDQVEAEVAYSW